MDLNVRAFLDAFRQAAQSYVQDLAVTDDLEQKFWRRWAAIRASNWVMRP
jgi:hypothetical protein